MSIPKPHSNHRTISFHPIPQRSEVAIFPQLVNFIPIIIRHVFVQQVDISSLIFISQRNLYPRRLSLLSHPAELHPGFLGFYLQVFEARHFPEKFSRSGRIHHRLPYFSHCPMNNIALSDDTHCRYNNTKCVKFCWYFWVSIGTCFRHWPRLPESFSSNKTSIINSTP